MQNQKDSQDSILKLRHVINKISEEKEKLMKALAKKDDIKVVLDNKNVNSFFCFYNIILIIFFLK